MRLPWPLFVRSAPTTRYKESSWVPWNGCTVNLFWGHDISLMIAGFPPLISTSAESLLVLQRQSRHFSDIKQRVT